MAKRSNTTKVAAGQKGRKASAAGRGTESKIAELKVRLGEIADLAAASGVLGWDQATYMPKGGASARGQQLATLKRIEHQKLTDPALGKLLDQLSTALADRSPADDDAALVRVTLRDYEREIKIPPALVEKLSTYGAAAYAAWTVARPANDFASMAPLLAQGVDLSRQLARRLGQGAHVMDPLVDAVEPGLSVASVRAMFDDLRPPLVALVAKAGGTTPPDNACLLQNFSELKQLAFSLKMAEHFGYDLTRGRQDLSPHPFCTTFAHGDVRITTRVKTHDLSEALYSTLHEAGHAMYEQGIASKLDRTPLGGGVSAGVHESQSRLWENVVGRSESFLRYAYPLMQKQFPEQLKRVSQKTFYRAINRVAPSLIRTDADELTYNLHVMIRFDLECDLLDGKLLAKDLPEAWNARYASDLGVSSPTDTDGCLQDVHWFGGRIGGAFQSYTIGNILSAQFYEAALAKHPAISSEISQGKFSTLHGWLADNIYRHGRKFDPAELVEKATGSPMSTRPYLAYLEAKYSAPSLAASS